MILNLAILTLATGLTFANQCCNTIMVDGKGYTQIGIEDTQEYNCLSDCIYERDDQPGSKYCFRAGNKETACQVGTPAPGSDRIGTFYPAPSPIYQLDSGEESNNSMNENTNYTVLNYEDGYATTTRECATCEGQCRLHLKVNRTVNGTSSDEIRKSAKTISKHLKTEYKLQFKTETEQIYFAANIGWSWLGISANGELSRHVVDKYENGEKGLNEARSEFTRSISNYLNAESRIEAEAWVSSSSIIPSRVCFYFRIQNINLSDKKTIIMYSNDPDETKTGTTGPNGDNAKEIENEGINLKITTV